MAVKKKKKSKTHPTKAVPGAVRGRGPIYTEKLGKMICEALIKHKSLKAACEKEKILPERSTILAWRIDGKHKEFSDMYEQAYVAMLEGRLDGIFDVAELAPKVRQIVTTRTAGGSEGDEEAIGEETVTELERVDAAAVASQALQVKTLQWVASKVLPKFKDKVQHDPGPGWESLLEELNKGEKRKV